MAKSGITFVIMLFMVVSAFSFSVALMITGEIGGNPIYEMMVSGAESASAELGLDLKIVEGGYNSAKWEPNLIALAATGKYDLIVTFTEGMPKSVEKVADMFPGQKLALIDGIAPIKPNVYSLGFKDEEMCYLAGYAGSRSRITRNESGPYCRSHRRRYLSGDDRHNETRLRERRESGPPRDRPAFFRSR